jgi:hypothetical protein
MDCGVSDIFCQGMTWLSDNEFVATSITELVSHLGARASGIIGVAAAFIENHAQAIIGLAGLAFGFWKWWRYREQILHQRLAEYLRESDSRLRLGQHYVLNALQRPAPGQPFKLPLFAGEMLRSVLRERNWDRTTAALCVESSADWQLSLALKKIQSQMEIAEANITSLRLQFATAHILRGAIASSVAVRTPSRATERNTFALTEFRTVLRTPGHQKDLVATELEAHQLRKLGDFDNALEAYEELENAAANIEDQRTQTLLIARAKRYRAEILQARNSSRDSDGQLHFLGTLNAHSLLSSTIPGSALSLRADYAPFQGWDLIEEGDINYLEALVASLLMFRVIEGSHLLSAETSYKAVLTETAHRRFFGHRRTLHLRRAAKAGLMRAQQARSGHYDVRWLVPA